MIFPYPQHVFVCVFYRTLWWLRYRALIRTLRPWQLRNTLIPVWVTVRETSASPVISPPKHKGCALKSLLFLWGSQTIVTQYIALCLPVWTCCELPPGCWYAVAKMIWVVVYWFLFQCRSKGFFYQINVLFVCVHLDSKLSSGCVNRTLYLWRSRLLLSLTSWPSPTPCLLSFGTLSPYACPLDSLSR